MRALFVAYLFVSAALLLCAQTAHAWWCGGHMSTSRVAQTQMKPATIAYVEAVVGALSASGPFPKAADMTQVACWPDDLKDPITLHMMDGWHFIAQKYEVNGYTADPAISALQDENIAVVMKQLYAGIKANKQNPSGWAMGMAIANLIHFFGDIHQPLHTVRLYDKMYPKGDAGGNFEAVTVDGTATNLHAIWDAVCWTWPEDPVRPLSAADTTKIDDFASYLLKTYSFTNSQVSVYDPQTMAAESLELAKTVAYPGIVNNTVITADYLAKCLPVAEGRIALGGMRLGHQLEALLGTFAAEWYANQEQLQAAERASKNKKGPIASFIAKHQHAEEALFNRTADTLATLHKRLEHALAQRAKKFGDLRNE